MRCAKCDCLMVPGHQKVRPGHRVHRARGLCTVCWYTEDRNGTLAEWTPRRPRPNVHTPDTCPFCEDVLWMAQTGASAWEMVRRLETTHLALERRLQRHGLHMLAAAVERDQGGVAA